MTEQEQGCFALGEAALEAAVELQEMLEAVDREIASLDFFRRTMLTGLIRQRAGMGIENWRQAACELLAQLQALDQPGQPANEAEPGRFRSGVPAWKGKLEQLASCFQSAARDAKLFVRDPVELAKALDALDYREQVVRNTITALEQLQRA